MKSKALTYLLACISMFALTVKVLPPPISSIPQNIDGVVDTNFTIEYPSSYIVKYDDTYISKLSDNTFRMCEEGETSIELRSGIRTYKIPIKIEQSDINSILFYDKDGVELNNIKIKLGETLYTVNTNELMIPDSISESSDIVLVTGQGSTMKQLLLGKLNKDETITIVPEGNNSTIRGNRVYINLAADTINKNN